MWKLTKPTRTIEETYTTCISRVRNVDLRDRLNLIKEEIIQASKAYETAATSVMLHTVATSDNIGGLVSVKEMQDVYTYRMAKKNRPGRPIYDELLSAPPHARCPLCGQRNVTTLDHHLPKTLYPALVVTPSNLIPSCSDCNKLKLTSIARNSKEETFHPYFDDVQDDLWLYAEVIESNPAALRFYVQPPIYWSELTAARAQRHFQILHLGELYASHAAVELINIRYNLIKLFEEAGLEGVKSHLARQAESSAYAFTNSWQTATYTALATNDWFCQGGFK